MSFLRYLCMFLYSGIFTHALCFCFVFLRLVCPMLPVSLDCQFFIAPSALTFISSEMVGRISEDKL
jgi:hypothetical protein